MHSSTLKRWALLPALGIVAASIVMASPASATTTPPAGAPAAASCATPVFETAGYKDGMTLSMFAYFNSHVPAGYQARPIPYQDGVFPTDTKDLDAATANGTAKLDAAVQAFHATCPDTRIIIAGHSEGAIVAGDEINALAASNGIPHSLIHGVLYGDPRRPFGDGGIGGTAGGIETNLPTILPGVTMRGPNSFGDIPVHEICDENDGICNSSNMITNAAAFANGLAGFAGVNGTDYHTSYAINPVRDLGDGLTLIPEQPIIPYGAPLPVPVGTPWQLSQGDPAAASAAVRTAMNTVNALLPAGVRQELAALPWYQLANQA